MGKLTHLSLFSGIGGLDLAAEWAGFETVGQCEWADFPTKVLEKHWPDVPRWRDVRELTVESFRERTGRETVDCISGGFPCQPHSVAGKRKASSDERDLWPEMRRVIGEIKPRWVVAENVRGLLSSEDGRFFRGILRDFADMGFNVGWCTYRAADVGAIHARERVAVIANSNSDGFKRRLLEDKGNVSKRMLTTLASCEVLHEISKDKLSESAVCRTLNGIPNGALQLKAYGNAVSPPQFYPIFKAIADCEASLMAGA
jgi:DNA (cytosine-5)-methyltransferase 1